MEIKRMHTGEKLSRVVMYNNTVYLCGQVGKDLDADITEQTKSTLARIDEHLAEAGTDKTKLLACTVYIKNAGDVGAMNAVWNDWLKDCATPSRTCVVADFANPKILVEITPIAAA